MLLLTKKCLLVRLLVIFSILLLAYNNLSARSNYNSAEEQAEALRKYYKQSSQSLANSPEELQNNQLFFMVFPNNFEQFMNIYLSEGDSSKKPVIKRKFTRNEIDDHLKLFYNIGAIHKLPHFNEQLYYEKYINIALDATQELYQDNSSYVPYWWGYLYALHQFSKDLYRKLYYNTDLVLEVLEKRQEADIVTFFHFVLMGPLPDQFKGRRMSRELQHRIIEANPTIYSLPAVKHLFDKYISIEEQAETLIENYEKALNRTGKNRARYEQIFFNNFPSSIEDIKTIFRGFDSFEPNFPLYGYKSSLIDFFCRLVHVDKVAYYNKYINLNIIEDVLDNENIEKESILFTIYSPLRQDMKLFIFLLAKRTVREIKSTFYCIFYALYSKNLDKQAIYEELYPKMKVINPLIAQLFKEVYEEVIATDDGHGH